MIQIIQGGRVHITMKGEGGGALVEADEELKRLFK